MLVVLSIVLMTLDHRQQHLPSLRSALSMLVYPLQLAVDFPHNALEWMGESLASRRALQEENARLRTQHLVLQAELQKLASLQRENLRLRELLDSSFKVGERVLIAELMAVDLDPYRHQVLLNRGSRAGVFVGQPILDARGVMGQILRVTPLTSTAMLITDPGHAIPVQLNRNGLRTIALGTGSLTELSLPHMPNNADIRVDDLLVTSGLGGRFPPGYPVGVVTEVARDPGRAFAEVRARPLAALDRSREVLLVWLPRELPPGEAVAATADIDAPAGRGQSEADTPAEAAETP